MGIIMDSINGLIKGIEIWKNNKNENQQSRDDFNDAIGSVMNAVITTKAYLYDSKNNKSREVERQLSEKWQIAATAIEKYDKPLFQSAQIKALGWADPNEWKRAEKIQL